MKISLPGFIRRPAAMLMAAALFTAMAGASLAQQEGPVLRDTHPERYVVKSGDTLWDISAMFLRDPWYWPEIWYANPQVENPHLIYPGDVLTLVYVDGRPQLRLERGAAARLSPRVREEALDEAITTIPREVIAPFLGRGVVLEKRQYERLPYVVAFDEGRLLGASGNDVYVRNVRGSAGTGYSLVRAGAKLVDPDDGDVVGYEGTFIADGTLRREGDPGTLRINASAREAREGDRLVDGTGSLPLDFQPRPPSKAIDGRIIHVVDGVTQIGQYQVVVLNRGQRDGLEPGHVLTAWRAGEKVPDRVDGGLIDRKVRLPDEPAGTVMVFRTWERISYALVMQAVRPIHVLDKVRNPG